jgi:hypothetical protein
MNEYIIRSAGPSGPAFAARRSARRACDRSSPPRYVVIGGGETCSRSRLRSALRSPAHRSPAEPADEILAAYAAFVAVSNKNTTGLPEEAWRHESFENIADGKQLLAAIKRCYAAAFSELAIAYREEHGFDQLLVARLQASAQWRSWSAHPPDQRDAANLPNRSDTDRSSCSRS